MLHVVAMRANLRAERLVPRHGAWCGREAMKEESRERGLRKRAAKLGLKIVKNRMRKDPSSPHYKGYHLLDTATNGQLTFQDWTTLDVVEQLIADEEKRRVNLGEAAGGKPAPIANDEDI